MNQSINQSINQSRKERILANSLVLLPLLTLIACGGGSGGKTPITPPAAKPQIVLEGPGVPGSADIQEISTANLDGSHIVQITHDGLNKFLPHFAPDGTRLVYTKFLTGKYGDPSPETDIFSYSFASAAETRLTTLGNAFQAIWSPDGQQIAFGAYDGSGLYFMNPDGSGQHLVGKPSGALGDLRWNDFAWSSDNWIVFTVGQNTNNCFKSSSAGWIS